MTPIRLAAGLVIVGAMDAYRARRVEHLREPEVEHFHGAVVPDLDVGRLEVAVNDAALMSRMECLDDLPGDRKRLVEWHATARNPIGQCRTFHQLQDEGVHPRCGVFFDPMDRRDVRVTEGGEHQRFAMKTSEAVRI
jgi:hypothetical protein